MPSGVIMDTASERAAAEIFTSIRMRDTTKRALRYTLGSLVDYRRDLAADVHADGHPKLAKAIQTEADVIEANLSEIVAHLEAEFIAAVQARQVAT